MNEWWPYVVLIAGMLFLAHRQMRIKQRTYRRMPDRDFPRQWRVILEKRIPFYQRLSSGAKQEFENEVHIFLLNFQISGNGVEITDLDRVLVAAAGVIPTFRLQKWHYKHLNEVVIYPDKFLIPETDKYATGLVGWGGMEGQMWLSRKALYYGFHNDSDQKNVAIHEFVHLMDMQDGVVDGVLEQNMSEEDIRDWLFLIENKTIKIGEGDSSIREYAGSNRIEFLAATAEFYFESPDKLRSEHPRLFRAMEKIFNQ